MRDVTIAGIKVQYEPKPEKNTVGYWVARAGYQTELAATVWVYVIRAGMEAAVRIGELCMIEDVEKLGVDAQPQLSSAS